MPEIDRWNRALLDVLLPVGVNAGQPVVLACDDESVRLAGDALEIDDEDALGELLRACREHYEITPFRAALEEHGRVDCLVSNATNLDVYRDEAPESALWDAHYHVDVLGAVRLTELLAPQMRERGAGSVVFVSSISGMTGQGEEHGYVAMKAALIAAGKTIGVELARDGVRVNVVAPGTLATADLDRMRRAQPDRVRVLEESIRADASAVRRRLRRA